MYKQDFCVCKAFLIVILLLNHVALLLTVAGLAGCNCTGSNSRMYNGRFSCYVFEKIMNFSLPF